MKLPFISIIIPTYNSEKTVKNALESIITQKFQYYEVLIIDGLSTDSTPEIVTTYIQKNTDHIKWVSEKDTGIYDAMNKGIGLASGEWVLFLGSDDRLYDEDVLEELATIIKKSDADLIYGNAILMGDGQRYGGEFNTLRLHTVQNLCHQTIFYRREIFNKLGKYNLKYKVVADWDYNIRCFRHPDIKTLYVERDIVLFNNLTGVSSMPHDDPFYKEVPVYYINELNKAKLEIKDILNSRAYTVGKYIYNFVKRSGIVYLVNKIRNFWL